MLRDFLVSMPPQSDMMPGVRNQTTLKRPISLSGIGLHSGQQVEMTFRPAEAGSGIRFCRLDVDEKPEIPAQVRYVSQTTRSTTITWRKWSVHTVEHVLATLAGYGIDNLVIELGASEPPIADGSAAVYCKMVEEAGIQTLDQMVEPFTIPHTIEFEVDQTLMVALPHPGLKITCTSTDAQGRFTQFESIDVTPESWVTELSRARTFCFFEELEQLFKHGLIQGGSLQNAVVIREDAILTTEPMRYSNEFVRHKMLDILGDLSLVGRPLIGHFIAFRPGHSANCLMAQKIASLIGAPNPVGS